MLRSFHEYARDLGVGAFSHDVEYAGDRAYPDDAFLAGVDAVARHREISADDVLEEFGTYLGSRAFPRLAPRFYDAHPSLRSALLHVEEEIHERVRDVIPGALPPRLRVAALGDYGVVVAYTSERGLCRLLEGLVRGTAAFYEQDVVVEQPQCMRRGEPACSIVVTLG